MKIWIEVSGGYLWSTKLSGEKGLYAPAGTRYKNMMKKISPGDVVLHYITSQRALKKEQKSSFIGISIADSYVYRVDRKLLLSLTNILEFPEPIKFSEIAHIKNKSEKFNALLKINFQSYISEIKVGDLKSIIEVKRENYAHLLKNARYKEILT